MRMGYWQDSSAAILDEDCIAKIPFFFFGGGGCKSAFLLMKG